MLNSDGKIIPGASVTLQLDGKPLPARRGQTVAAAMLAAGQRVLRHTRRTGKPRGLFCAMGVCFDCVMTIDGEPGVRACMTKVEEGMRVISPVQFKPYERKS
jgi:succinate dehydrogenase/fumarate reductase-like Fe-S protein